MKASGEGLACYWGKAKMTTLSQSDVRDAAGIPPLSHSEAGVIARTEVDRFLALVRQLDAADWEKPTDCTLWNVRQILAHQAGAYAGFASWGQFVRQWSQLLKRRAPGELPVDLVNRRQVADRAQASPAALIRELEEVGPRAIAVRQRLPGPLRALRLPFGPPLGVARVDYLTDLIYTRDTWSHRLDICRAVARPMTLTAEHDGRLVALVVRDLAAQLQAALTKKSVILRVVGPAGGLWRLGLGDVSATLQMDALDFIRLTSGRLAPEEVHARSLVTIEGNRETAQWLLVNAEVPY